MRLRAPVLARGLATGRTALVKDLRARTSAPMAKCVEALKATDDDVDGAIDWLRKAGLASAGKKAARGAHEGAIALAGTDTALALVEVNTETDFVARNELFHALCADIAASALGLGEAGARGDVNTAALGAIYIATLKNFATSISRVDTNKPCGYEKCKYKKQTR